jgi:signal peptidase II
MMAPSMPAPDPSSAPNEPTRKAIRSPGAIALFLITAIVLLTADLVTKSMAFERVAGQAVVIGDDPTGPSPIPPHDSRIVIPNVLALHLTVNQGAVFGLGEGGRWVFVVFSIVASCAIGVVFGRSDPRSPLLHLALASVLAGAIGNLYDRLRFGVVRDMLLLFPGVKLPFGWTWPDGSPDVYPWIFNVADVCLVGGLIVLMILMYRHDRRVALEAKRNAAADGRAA